MQSKAFADCDVRPRGRIPYIIKSTGEWPLRSLPVALADYIQATGPRDSHRRAVAARIYFGLVPNQKAEVKALVGV